MVFDFLLVFDFLSIKIFEKWLKWLNHVDKKQGDPSFVPGIWNNMAAVMSADLINGSKIIKIR